MQTLRTLFLCALTVAALSACGGGKAFSCKEDDRDYAGAQEMPPLKAPAGLDAPDTRNALKIPPLNEPERKRGKDEACLDFPPPFAPAKAATPAAS